MTLIDQALQTVNEAIDQIYPERYSLLFEANRYALLSSGKRIRPLICLASADWMGQDYHDMIPLAVSLEMIHSYSLVHDDLPEMDNDEWRRGKPSVHKQFGHGLALLVGDSLLTDAWQVVLNSDLPSYGKVEALSILSEGAGSKGMIYGQFLDSVLTMQAGDIIQLEKIHRHKTGALLEASALSVFPFYEPELYLKQRISRFIKIYGLAFQIHNDLKDVLLTKEDAGKDVLKDQSLEKTTYPSLLGVEQTLNLLEEKLTILNNILDELTESNPESKLGQAVYRFAIDSIDPTQMRELYEERTH
ncbi:polyprenyl synthetase family protein [Atopobacter phocae]|uniref:polyprenyl synthetase family protein n=1 Tax=Atopobacter phocae TaxID=136492 RepID=UPI00046F0332|nr:polyprenyl synthetase family protein [Atopobacter phocae]